MFGRDGRNYGSYGYSDQYNSRYQNDNYGYGYSNYQQQRGGLFSRRNSDYGNYGGGYGNSYGSYGGGYGTGGLFGRQGGYGTGGLFGRQSGYGSGGLFGRRGGYGSYGSYGARRGLFSTVFGGVGLGIVAIGSLVGGAVELGRRRKERRTSKGKRPYSEMELSFLWYREGGIVKIPVNLLLYYTFADTGDYDSRYTVKVGRRKTVKTKNPEDLQEYMNEVEDGVTCCINFSLTTKGNGLPGITVDKSYSKVDDWECLQLVCDRLNAYFDELYTLLKEERVRNEPLEFVRLKNTVLAAVLEEVGFVAARTVDCKKCAGDAEYSWCVTDVALRRKDGNTVTVRVDLSNPTKGDNQEPPDEQGESVDAGISYSFAAGGVDIFDGREVSSGSGEFVGWEDVDSHMEEVSKGMTPVEQGITGRNGKMLKIPVVSSIITKRRNAHRIGSRNECRRMAYAEEPNTDVVFRNLLWYNTKSKPGKTMIKVLPFCLLVTFDEVDGVVDRDVKPVSVGYNFFPVETEFVCSSEDVELYEEEISNCVSFALNFGIAEKNGKLTLRRKKINSVEDSWERLQLLVDRSSIILDTIFDSIGGWVEHVQETSMSEFESALLAAVLKLAGFSYAKPIIVEGDWSVVDVSLIRPATKTSIFPRRLIAVSSGVSQRQETFERFIDGSKALFAQARTDSVIVRVNMSASPVTFGYSEEPIETDDGKPIVNDRREGSEPFTGWENDASYVKRRHSSHKVAQAKLSKARAERREQMRGQFRSMKRPEITPIEDASVDVVQDEAQSLDDLPWDPSETSGEDLHKMNL